MAQMKFITVKGATQLTGTHIFSIAGADLGPDGTKADEYVALVSGKYTVKVYTSSGMGEDMGVACAMRKVMVA